MSKFSEYLESYIKQKNYTVSRLAAKMNMDRSILHRYVKGTRVPAEEELVHEIATALCMTVAERECLLEHYERIIYGDEKIDNYVCFKRFLERLKECENRYISNTNLWKADIEFDDNFNIMWLNSREEIVSIIRHLLSNISNADCDESKRMYMIMQPDNVIQEYIRPCLENTNVRIEQIIHLEQRDSLKHKNLDVLLNMLGTCFGNLHYTVYYYFCDDIREANSMYWMPNVIIMDDYVIQFDADMHYGSVIKDDGYKAGAMRKYREIKKNTYLFMKDTRPEEDLIGFYGDDSFSDTIDSNLFFEPCVGFSIGRDLLESNLYEFDGKMEYIELREKVGGCWSNMAYFPPENLRKCKPVIRFKYDGLIRFMETGRTSEFPNALYKKLDMSQRVLTLRRMIELLQKGYVRYFLIDDSVDIPEKIFIYRYAKMNKLQLNLFTGDVAAKVSVNEAGFGYIFDLFIEGLERKGLIKSTEETLIVLEEVCERYSQKC